MCEFRPGYVVPTDQHVFLESEGNRDKDFLLMKVNPL
jgi:hypothetical protein